MDEKEYNEGGEEERAIKKKSRMSGNIKKNAKDKQMRAGDVEGTDCRQRRALLRANVGL